MSQALGVTQLIGFGLFLWVGLYLLVYTPRYTPLIVVALLGLFAQASFFALQALTDAARSLQQFVVLERLAWWTAILPLALWMHASSLILRSLLTPAPAERQPIFTSGVATAYTAAVFIGVFGAGSDLFLDLPRIIARPDGGFHIGPGPAYPLYLLYQLLTAGWAALNLLRARHSADRLARNPAVRQQLWLLTLGALLFLAGALMSSSQYYWQWPISQLPAYLALLLALGLLAYGIAQYGLLLEGANIRRDFFYSLTGISLLNLVYVLLLVPGGDLQVFELLLLVTLVTLTHTTFDSGRALLDRLFFSSDERVARAAARNYANALGSSPISTVQLAAADGLAEPAALPEPAPPLAGNAPAVQSSDPAPDLDPLAAAPDLKQFRDLVRRALTGLRSPPQLAISPLLSLALIEERVRQAGLEDNRLNRTAALRELLIEQIDGLRPADDPGGVGDASRFYNVLHYPYVREMSRKRALNEARRLAEERKRAGQREASQLEQVLSWLADVDEDTFYKWQRRASDMIAAVLWEENQKLSRPATTQ